MLAYALYYKILITLEAYKIVWWLDVRTCCLSRAENAIAAQFRYISYKVSRATRLMRYEPFHPITTWFSIASIIFQGSTAVGTANPGHSCNGRYPKVILQVLLSCPSEYPS